MNFETLQIRVSELGNTTGVGPVSYKTENLREQLERQFAASPTLETYDPYKNENPYVQDDTSLSHAARLEALLHGPDATRTQIEVPVVPDVTFSSTGRVDYVPTLFTTESRYTYTNGGYLPLFEFLDEHTQMQNPEVKARIVNHISAYRRHTMKFHSVSTGRLFPITSNQFLCVEFCDTEKAGKGFGIYNAFVISVGEADDIEICPVAKLSGPTEGGSLPVLWEPQGFTGRVQSMMSQYPNHPTIDMVRDVYLSQQNFHPEMIEGILSKLLIAEKNLTKAWIAAAQFIVKHEPEIRAGVHIKTVMADLNFDSANQIQVDGLIDQYVYMIASAHNPIHKYQEGVQQVITDDLTFSLQTLQNQIRVLGKALENIQQLRYQPQDLVTARNLYQSIRKYTYQLRETIRAYSDEPLGLWKGKAKDDHHFAIVVHFVDAVCALL